MRRPLLTLTAAGLASLLPWLPCAMASASTIPSGITINRKIAGARVTAPYVAPQVHAWDNFNRANGPLSNALSGFINGVVGPIWNNLTGSWAVASSSIARTGTTGTAVMAVDCGGHVDATAHVTLSNLSSLGGFLLASNSAGITASSNGTKYFKVVYQEDTTTFLIVTAKLMIVTYNGSSDSTRASLSLSRRSSLSMKVTQDGSTIKVYLDGATTPALSYTLTGAEASTSTGYRTAAATRYGMYGEGADNVNFDDYRCESVN